MFDFKNIKLCPLTCLYASKKRNYGCLKLSCSPPTSQQEECDLLCPVYLEQNTAKEGCGLLPMLVTCAHKIVGLPESSVTVCKKLAVICCGQKGD